MTRTGAQYLEMLQDGREVWLGGERIDNVTTHPAFRNTARAFAHLYDMTHEPDFRDVLTYESPKTGERVNRAHQIPRSYEDLVTRRKAIKTWSEATYGWIGRTPDYKAVMWSGLAATPHVFDQGEFKGGANVTRYYEHARDNDLFIGHAIVNPQINRTKSASEQAEDFLYLGIVDERDDGIVVRGAKMIATGAVFADAMHISSIAPLGPGDADYAVAFVVPIATPGVKLISRRSYEAAASSVFDYPLSKRYDENDALMVFEDVFVPWENVLIYKDVELMHTHWWDTPAEISTKYQFAVRQWTKLEFLMGLAVKLTKQNGIYRVPAVQERLAQILSKVLTVKSMVIACEANYEWFEDGSDVVTPNRELINGFHIAGPQLYPQVIDSMRWLIGGGPMQVPASYEAFVNEEIAGISRRYNQGAGVDGETRTKVVKAVWDAIGSEAASRHELYERFALGPSYANSLMVMSESNIDLYEALADDLFSTYSLQDAIDEATHWTPPTYPQGHRARARRSGAVEGAGTIATVQERGFERHRVNPIVAMANRVAQH